MNFSTNQVRHLYVIPEQIAYNPHSPISYNNPGLIGYKQYNNNGIHMEQGTYDTESISIMFMYRNALSELTHSDIIPVNNIRSVRYTPAASLRIPLCKQKITVTQTPSVGDIVYLNFTFPAFISLTPEENMTKTICFEYKTGSSFATQLKAAIDAAFASNYNTTNKLIETTISGNDVIVKATMPKWRRGLMEARPNDFQIDNLTYEDMNDPTLSSLPLENNSRIKTWGSVDSTLTNTTTPGDYITNGRQLADLEYFCMGERGDVYRGIGWPNNIETHYMLETKADVEAEYDVCDIHYYYQGEGINDDKAEKVITFVLPKNEELGKLSGTAALNALLSLMYDITSV